MADKEETTTPASARSSSSVATGDTVYRLVGESNVSGDLLARLRKIGMSSANFNKARFLQEGTLLLNELTNGIVRALED